MDEEDRLRFDRIFGTAKRFDEELRTSPLDPLDKADVCVIMLTDLLKESYGYAEVEAVDHVLTGFVASFTTITEMWAKKLALAAKRVKQDGESHCDPARH
jgi:hypothetical protein